MVLLGISGVCSMHGYMRSAYKILVGKPEKKKPLFRTRRIRKDNIKLDSYGLG